MLYMYVQLLGYLHYALWLPGHLHWQFILYAILRVLSGPRQVFNRSQGQNTENIAINPLSYCKSSSLYSPEQYLLKTTNTTTTRTST